MVQRGKQGRGRGGGEGDRVASGGEGGQGSDVHRGVGGVEGRKKQCGDNISGAGNGYGNRGPAVGGGEWEGGRGRLKGRGRGTGEKCNPSEEGGETEAGIGLRWKKRGPEL